MFVYCSSAPPPHPTPPQFHHELFMRASINSGTQSASERRRLTGSWRGVQLHFLRRFSLLLIGPYRQASVPGDPPLPPSSRARAAASVARQQRSEVGPSSPAEEGERHGWFVLCDWCIAPPLTRRRKTCYAAAEDLFLERWSRASESADIYDISCVVYLIYTSVPA